MKQLKKENNYNVEYEIVVVKQSRNFQRLRIVKE